MKVFIIIILLIAGITGCSADYWFTPDQQGDRQMKAKKFDDAARLFVDPTRKGVALFRAGKFEAAVAAFGRQNTPEAHYNRGNSLVMLGKYTDAVAAYDRALDAKRDWRNAQENMEIARIRADRMELEGGDMTGGMLGADEIVFDEGGKNKSDGEETVEADSGSPLSDEQLRALWLRRVQTKPADFLKAKFSYQYGKRSEQ